LSNWLEAEQLEDTCHWNRRSHGFKIDARHGSMLVNREEDCAKRSLGKEDEM
jgi:hypothetical protein